MKFNFKKVSSVLASAAMLGSTIGIAAAASYPAPFVSGGMADVAIVVGATAAQTDFVAATDVGSNLNTVLATQTVSGGGAVTTSGENIPLFTSSSKIYLNESINVNKGTLTKSELATTLADSDFSGNVDADITQRIILGSNPIVSYAKQPTGDEDPRVGIALSTTVSTKYIYNATMTFDQAVNFTHADSKGESLNLFGQKFTVSSATSSTKIVLLKSSEKLSLSVGGDNPNPSQSVTVDGKTYTVELTAATDSSATVRVTDSNGKSDSKQVNEAQSKKIQGLEVAVDLADESTALGTASAEVLVGAAKVTLQDGNAVKMGTDDDTVDGTNVDFVDTTNTGNITQLIVQVTAADSDVDAIIPGMSFVDPVFGSFKVDFPGLNIADDDTSREKYEIKNSGAEKITVLFTDYNGDTPSGSVTWVYNKSDAQGPYGQNISSGGAGAILASEDNERIIVAEMSAVNRSEFVMVGNEDEGGLFEVSTISNATSGYSDDVVELKDVFTGTTTKATITSEGVGSIVLKGKSYDVNYYGAQSLDSSARYIRLNYPDTSSNSIVLYPTIQTQKGAKIAFYQPLTISLMTQPISGNMSGSNFNFPDGDGYTTAAVVINQNNATIGGNNLNMTVGEGVSSTPVTVGTLVYNFSNTGVNADNRTAIRLVSPGGNTNINKPALVIFEEKSDSNDNSVYQAVVVTLDAGYDGSSAGIGINDIDRTWSADGAWDDIQLETNDDIYKDMDRWGTIATVDKSDTDQATATISYPDDQVYAQVYFSAASASVSSGSGGTAGNIVPVYDNEAAKISGKNLVVVGGSCVNTVAAELLGSTGKLCGADFTAKTQVGAGQYLIQSFSRSGKVATLVAGYNAADTTNAAKSLVANKPDTGVGKKYTGTTADTISAA